MNKYIRAAYCVPFGMIKMAWTKIFHLKNFYGPLISLVSPYSEISLDYGAKLRIGENFKMRDGAKLRVRKGAVCIIGKNSSINTNNIIVCHDKIEIGNDVQFSPNVQIYDHDHDFRVDGGIKSGKYRTAPVIIGNNVWIGANVAILRGSEIGNNVVIAAGSIVKGRVPDGTVYVQKRETIIK